MVKQVTFQIRHDNRKEEEKHSGEEEKGHVSCHVSKNRKATMVKMRKSRKQEMETMDTVSKYKYFENIVVKYFSLFSYHHAQ